MDKMRVYISADYDEYSGDRNVVEQLNKWSGNNHLLVNFTDMAKVVSGSVSKDSDCRICDLKKEFNMQINLSSIVVCVIGDKTKCRTSGSSCGRRIPPYCYCTPYKQNPNGLRLCKISSFCATNGDVSPYNEYSYLRHEFEQAKRKDKKIVIVYNSLNRQPSWLPSYMEEFKCLAFPFWTLDVNGNRVGDYQSIKKALGYE